MVYDYTNHLVKVVTVILPNDQYLFLKQQFCQTSAKLWYSGYCKCFGHIRAVQSQPGS